MANIIFFLQPVACLSETFIGHLCCYIVKQEGVLILWIYGSNDESTEAYRSYMPQNKRDKLNTTAQNSANSAVIDKYASDKDEDGVDEPDIVAGVEDN